MGHYGNECEKEFVISTHVGTLLLCIYEGATMVEPPCKDGSSPRRASPGDGLVCGWEKQKKKGPFYHGFVHSKWLPVCKQRNQHHLDQWCSRPPQDLRRLDTLCADQIVLYCKHMTVDLDLHHVRIQSGMCAFYHGLVHLKMALTIGFRWTLWWCHSPAPYRGKTRFWFPIYDKKNMIYKPCGTFMGVERN